MITRSKTRLLKPALSIRGGMITRSKTRVLKPALSILTISRTV